MSERLQDLERALTSGTAADGDGSATSKHSLSVSMTRKPSLIIRRTLSSFRWALLPAALPQALSIGREMCVWRSWARLSALRSLNRQGRDPLRLALQALAWPWCLESQVKEKDSCSSRGLESCRRRTSDASQRLVGGDMSRAASIAGFEDPLGDDNDCGICLEADLDVAINGCKHRLCIDCSIRSDSIKALWLT